MIKKPDWLKVKLPPQAEYTRVQSMMDNLKLHTVCQEANCPNLGECFFKGTATFMIMGDYCTRRCRFCVVSKGSPASLDPDEPLHVAEAVQNLKLKHAVVTSVTRDDLDDNGSSHYVKTIKAIKELNPHTTVEVLIPDFQGSDDDLLSVLDAKPEILNHNLETVPRLYGSVRPTADYQRSLSLLKRVKEYDPSIFSKTGIMVGLGETEAEVIDIMKQLVEIKCDIMTIGQYLQPTDEQLPVYEYVTPEQFEKYKKIGEDMGIPYVESGPFIRSSYNAAKAMDKLKK